MVPLVYLNF